MDSQVENGFPSQSGRAPAYESLFGQYQLLYTPQPPKPSALKDPDYCFDLGRRGGHWLREVGKCIASGERLLLFLGSRMLIPGSPPFEKRPDSRRGSNILVTQPDKYCCRAGEN